jgi:hypothetical protein
MRYNTIIHLLEQFALGRHTNQQDSYKGDWQAAACAAPELIK